MRADPPLHQQALIIQFLSHKLYSAEKPRATVTAIATTIRDKLENQKLSEHARDANDVEMHAIHQLNYIQKQN